MRVLLKKFEEKIQILYVIIIIWIQIDLGSLQLLQKKLEYFEK